jgi:hypothetical protein
MFAFREVIRLLLSAGKKKTQYIVDPNLEEALVRAILREMRRLHEFARTSLEQIEGIAAAGGEILPSPADVIDPHLTATVSSYNKVLQ